ncbi:MAG: bifunctional endoribonuclease/protein kinase ire1 [Claussenomyces sp. TS43310]|nr:MAG: bifunctional endoribonuclease/protein kinase ire1 [Claussenomyces sp. TS43310]
MMRRPPGKGPVANSLLLACIFVLLAPWLVEAQQQQQQPSAVRSKHESPHERPVNEVLHALEATRLPHQSQQLETPLIPDGRKSTWSMRDDDNDNNNKNNNKDESHDASAIATLAPANPAVRAPPSRRSSIETAGLSSPQITRSLADWEVEDFVLLATIDGKLYARDRKTGRERWTLEVDKPMVETMHHRRNRSVLEDTYLPVHDYLWIVEPSRDGSIFIYVPSGSHGGLVNTGLTMKKLVEEMSPFKDEEPAVVYTGDKKTTMITLDARTGRVLRWFGSAGALVNDEQSCRTTGLMDFDKDECSTSGTLTLGRTEYTVGIHGTDGHEIAMLKYSEWGPNNFDTDLHRQYRTTKDGKYVYPKHDGSIFSYDFAHKAEPSRLFNQKFPSPVVRVFDIARPWGTEDEDPELVVLPQPVPPAVNDDLAGIRASRIFLNHTEDGSWYAMSGHSYPFAIEGPELAKCDHHEWWQHGTLWEDLNDAQLSKALVGLHRVDSEGSARPLTISAPPSRELDNGNVSTDDVGIIIAELPTVTDRLRRIPRSAIASLSDFIYNPIVTIILISLLVFYNKDLTRKLKAGFDGKEFQEAASEITVDGLPEASKIGTLPATQAPVQLEVVEVIGTEDPAAVAQIDGIASTVKDGQPVKESVIQIVDGSAEMAQPTPEKKKKTHRGRRGGVMHKKGRAKQAESGEQAPAGAPITVEDAVRDAQNLGGKTGPIEPDVQTLPNGVAEVSGPILRLGSLEVNTDKLIGTGSNGTMVFEGVFDGRQVAVKRMLIQFFDIASQETKLLRESDDHPNVIRYFAQQQSAGFLYIALELCPASLADVIEKPHLHRELAQGGEKDLPHVLYQITNGLQHLHHLRIVHRDLKPQNILVTMGKNGRPRLLVSDFGLCKKLEGEQSSFRATTAHAAGTSGWRAPELLLDDDARDGSATAIDASTHSGSGPLLSADLSYNRRATRAIDIFSLGLVFFYVLTKGAHPYDCGDRYMREVNIRKGTFKLQPLEVLGDFAFEAKDLISSMLNQEPKRRPSARQVLAHPFFWASKKRLDFLCDVSDHFEKEVRDPPSPALQELEKWAPEVCHADFLKPLGKEFVESLGKQRKYTGTRLLDLLRALRNKKNHYEDLSESLKSHIGSLPDGYLSFWSRKFPNLLITCWNIVYEVQWDETDRFREYYQPAGL